MIEGNIFIFTVVILASLLTAAVSAAMLYAMYEIVTERISFLTSARRRREGFDSASFS